MLKAVRDHRLFIIVLGFFAVIFTVFPLQLQSMEVYSYAASIEKYYNLSATFALAQGEYLPDFGRYHLNHPLGHMIAGIVFDILGVSALSWMRFTNVSATLFSGAFLYFIAMRLNFGKKCSLLATTLFFAANVSLLTVYSGEWHIPSLALALAGTWKILIYLKTDTRKHLFYAATLFFFAVWYHTAGLSLTVCSGVALLAVRPKNWRAIMSAAAIAGACVLVVYFVVPLFLFKFNTVEDFARAFFMYKYLDHARYNIIQWIFVASQTIFHSIVYIPATMPIVNWLVFLAAFAFFLAAVRFFRGRFDAFTKLLFLFMLVGWPVAQAIAGSRPNAIFGWLFMLPFVSMILAWGIASSNRSFTLMAAIVPVFILAWNLFHWVLPNHRYPRENIFLFNVPRSISVETPVAFVANELVTTIGDIWNAGSNAEFRNQSIYYPCCGEHSFFLRLRRYLRENPRAIIVSDFAPAQIEDFLRSQNLHHVRWIDRSVYWPAYLLPTSLYFMRDPDYQYRKQLTVWIPAEGIVLP